MAGKQTESLAQYTSLVYSADDTPVAAVTFRFGGIPVSFTLAEAQSEDWAEIRDQRLAEHTELARQALDDGRELLLKAERGENVIDE